MQDIGEYMKDIDKDFIHADKKSILFLGKFHSFTKEEIELFLEKFEITYTDVLDEDVTMFVESTMLSPLEEDIAYEAIKKGITAYSAEDFEKLYASKLSFDSLLMSLKLSNDQMRLYKVLHNNYIEDELFLKLFKMYDWEEEGLFDNSKNMEISTLFTKRFYKKERFDPATFHSPISIFEIAIISEDSNVLEALFLIPNLTVKQSRSGEKRPVDLKQALATNIYLNKETIKRLVRLNDNHVDYFLAQNSIINDETIQIIFKRSDMVVKKALATNSKIDDNIFKALLDEAAQELFLHQHIDLDRYNLIIEVDSTIGENENLSDEVIEKLIEKKDEDTLKNLSCNESVKKDFLEKIYNLKNPAFLPYLATNKNLSQKITKELYAKNDNEINLHLALNPSLPREILDELYKLDNFEINKYLALNESMPIEYLQQLQLDSRLMNHLKENKTFTQNILNNLGI